MTVLNSRQTFTWTNVDQIPWCFLVSQGLNELNENWQFRNRFDTLRSRQNGRHFADGIFKSIFWNENCLIVIQISLKFAPKRPIDNMQAGYYGCVAMFPGSYVPRVLCSPAPMFPGSDVPPSYVPQYLCSPALVNPCPMFPGTYVPPSYVPRYLCSPYLCSPVPMFPRTYVPPFHH